MSQSPTALTKSRGNPAHGWWASCRPRVVPGWGADGDDDGHDGQRQVDDQVERGRWRVGPTEAAAGGERAAAPAGVDHDAGEGQVGQRDEGRPWRDAGSTMATAPSAASASAPTRTTERTQAQRRPARHQRGHGPRRVVGAQRLGHPGDAEQAGGNEVEADQFHVGLAAGTSETAGLSVSDDSSVLTCGTSAVRWAWLPSTA